MKYISENDFDDFFPNNIDYDLAEAKSLAINGKLNSEYFLLQSKYYKLFEEFLEKKLNLSKIEELLDSKNKNLKPVSEEEMDIYQYLSNHKYFYIRNTLFVENLTKENIQAIMQSEIMNTEIENIISSTYKVVIKVSSFENKNFETNYGPISSNFIASNDSLIFGIRFKEEDESDYTSEDEWFRDYCERRKIVEEFKKAAKQLFCNKLNDNVEVFEYFEEDVKKKNSSGLKL